MLEDVCSEHSCDLSRFQLTAEYLLHLNSVHVFISGVVIAVKKNLLTTTGSKCRNLYAFDLRDITPKVLKAFILYASQKCESKSMFSETCYVFIFDALQ